MAANLRVDETRDVRRAVKLADILQRLDGRGDLAPRRCIFKQRG
jgi:hypothetical protein